MDYSEIMAESIIAKGVIADEDVTVLICIHSQNFSNFEKYDIARQKHAGMQQDIEELLILVN